MSRVIPFILRVFHLVLPVLNIQFRISFKLTHVIGHEYNPLRSRVCRGTATDTEINNAIQIPHLVWYHNSKA